MTRSLWISAGLFLIALLLPNPPLEGTNTFTQHAIGGGAACAVAGLYIALNAGLRLRTHHSPPNI